jgi:polysaccharide biosynthesis protein PslH
MRILFLSPRQCFPARSGAKLREYHFLRALGASAEVTYLYFSDPGSEPLTVSELPFCREVFAVPKPSAYGLANNVRGIFGRWPLSILNYTSPEMSAVATRVLLPGGFDLIHLDSIHMIRYAPAGVRAIYNWHNIESEAMRRYGSSAASLPRRSYAKVTAAKLANVEQSILDSAFGHVVCSEREREQLAAIAPQARISVIENGVDTLYFAPAEPASPAARKIVFVGAMDYFPNSDAAVFFATEIWPHIRRRMPDFKLAIVGANPAPAVRALAELPGVTVTGTVPDVRPYYRDALAAIVPLRTGGGTRLKILEAMAAGVPIISTPLGAEGLAVSNGKNALIVDANDAESWINHIVSLTESPAHRAQIIDAAHRLVETRYDWAHLGAKLRETYGAWLAESTGQRSVDRN